MRKRGQAAMEFLMTYGWAILVVLIAIGALAFFGVLNPAKFLPQSCVLGPGLACEDFKVDSAAKNIYLNIRNGMGEDIDWMTVYIDKKTPTGTEMCGGFGGLIAVPTAPLRDGSIGKVQHFTGQFSLVDGLSCDRNVLIAPSTLNNCINPWYNILLPTSISLLQYVGILDQNIQCTQSADLGNKGTKFKQDLVITYKTRGSIIIHQRVGLLSAQIE